MPDRSLIYRVAIDVGSARASAQAIRRVIEAELRQIKLGSLNTASVTTAVNEAQRLRIEFERAAQAADDIRVPSVSGGGRSGGGGNDWASALAGQLPGGAGALGGAVLGGFAATATVSAIGEIGQALDDLSRRGAIFGQISSVLDDYAASVGTSADAIVSAAKKAAQGTISEFDLILNANRAIQFEVAKTPEQFAKLIELSTALGRAQGISDTDALDYLVRGIARQSSLILDNLGIFIDLDKVIGEYAQSLGKTSKELTAAERNQALLNESFKQGATAIQANRDASESAATSYEQFNAVVQDLKDDFGEWIATNSVGFVRDLTLEVLRLNDALNGERSQFTIELELAQAEKALKGLSQDNFGNAEFINMFGGDAADAAKNLEDRVASLRNELALLELPSSPAFSFEIPQADDVIRQQEEAARASRLAAEEAAAEREEKIRDQVGESLSQDAAKVVDTAGLEATLATLAEAKVLVDQGITNLINSAVTDPDEIALRIQQIQEQAGQLFDDLEERAGSVNIDFAGIDTALAMFDQGFVDYLPGMDDLRSQLIDLQAELAFTGTMTAEQAAELEYLQGAAAAAGGDAAMLADVTNELGSQFLYTNDTAAAVVDQMYQAAAAYMAGSITAEQYAGITSVLGNQLLVLASDAGVATGALSQLLAVQSGLAGTAGFEIGQRQGGAIAQRIQTQQATRQRDTARREAEQAAKRAVSEAERGAKRAASELEKGAKKARQELEAALKSVPGLFGRSPVTKEQMDGAAAGLPQNFADDYLRRLEDEVFNGNDWADVSIDEARAALERVGISASSDAKAAFQQFAQAWESSVLFSDKANLDFINQEAVNLQLTLEDKAKQGQANIYELFGIAIDDAVEAVGAGISGGGVSGSVGSGLTVPVKAELIPMSEGQTMPTLGGISPVIDIAAIQGQLNTLTLPELAFSATGLTELQDQINGVMATIEVGVTVPDGVGQSISSDIADQLATQISTFQSQGQTVGKIIADGVRTSLADANNGVALNYFAALDAQFSNSANFFYLIGQDTAAAINGGMAAGLSTASPDFAAAVAGMLVQSANTIKEQGGQVGGILIDGINESISIKVNDQQQVNTGLIDSLIFRFSAEIGARKADLIGIGTITSSHILMGARDQFLPTGAQGGGGNQSAIVSSMIDGIGTGIRASSELLRQRGGTVAREMISGFSVQFSSEEFKNTLIAAGETMASYLTIGILNGINGGQLVEAIGAQVLADITSTVQEPTQ